MPSRHETIIREALRRPQHAWKIAMALAKGSWYRTRFRLGGRRFRAGRNFRVFGRIVLKGPGSVSIGDDVVLYGRVTPWTHSTEARITIGDNCVLDGVRMGCVDSITIGADCLLAECHILDTDFHSTRADRRTNPGAPVRVAPVTIEDNVWIGVGAGLLPGTRIGRNSVVGMGAVCVRRYPDNVILFGNPAKVVAPVVQAPATAPEVSQPAAAAPSV
jgi:acetyltransferase-like isoleucine patch superfamily enzyme